MIWAEAVWMYVELQRIADRIDELAAAGRTRGRSWSLAQITEHLARTIEWQLGHRGAGQRPSRPMPKWLRPFVRRVFFRSGWIPKGVGTLDDLLPPSEIALDVALGRLRSAIEQLRASEADPPEHPYFGRMTRSEWEQFHVNHAQHHLRTIA